jgi:hypothetical protein
VLQRFAALLFHIFFRSFSFVEKIYNGLKIIRTLLNFMIASGPFFERSNLFNLFFGFLGVIPKIGSLRFLLFFFDFDYSAFDVKDAS